MIGRAIILAGSVAKSLNWLTDTAAGTVYIAGGIGVIIAFRKFIHRNFDRIRLGIRAPHLLAFAMLCITVIFVSNDNQIDILAFGLALTAVGSAAMAELYHRVLLPLWDKLAPLTTIAERVERLELYGCVHAPTCPLIQKSDDVA